MVNQVHKENCLSVALDVLECAKNYENFLKMSLTTVESWIYGYDPKSKLQSSQWISPSSLLWIKHVKCTANPKRCCWLFPSVTRVFCAMSVLHKIRLLTVFSKAVISCHVCHSFSWPCQVCLSLGEPVSVVNCSHLEQSAMLLYSSPHRGELDTLQTPLC
jgi:hypothetical protein